jgi:hypothetical protein
MPPTTASAHPPENDQTFSACRYLKTASSAPFLGKRPNPKPAQPKSTKARQWT